VGVARVLSEELQGHAEDGGNLGIVGQVLDVIGDHAHIGRHANAVQGNQRAERADDFDQAGRQADFFFGFAQGGEDQVRVFGVATPAGKGHFAAMGRQAAGAQGQDQLRFVTAGNRHQHAPRGNARRSRALRRVVAYPAK
jgi:hypothetical protein